MLLVISPAKNLDETSELPNVKATQPALLSEAATLIKQLQSLAPHDICTLMKLSDKLGTLNYERFQAWQQPFTLSNARPAVLTFNGDVYQGLDAANFSGNDFTFAQKHLRILSGLYGLLRPLDLIQAYRLEMGTKFANNRGKDLYAFWGTMITDALNAELKNQGSNTVVNLASTEYFKAVKVKQLNADIIEPVFKDYKNGQYKIISFYAKKARGLMSAYCIKNAITKPEQLKAFDVAGYGFSAAESTAHKWVFTRNLEA
ncbi:peroxide stress protein YaaA [Marinagarivorans algicola]|uniref:peroxide stress protein YaaA n=1 Tax=Marinagarivorans algicola TaxID=1513270 RepID=UPI0006B9C56D|nr:peroxide stress protein YaaA [Marinagarivorans algicola]